MIDIDIFKSRTCEYELSTSIMQKPLASFPGLPK